MQDGSEDFLEMLFRVTTHLCEGKQTKVVYAIICAAIGLLVFVLVGLHHLRVDKPDLIFTSIFLPCGLLLWTLSVYLFLTRE